LDKELKENEKYENCESKLDRTKFNEHFLSNC